MGRTHFLALGIHPLPGGNVTVQVGPQLLANVGCNVLVEVATAAAFVNDPTNPTPRRQITLLAHVDTGAIQTTISHVIAQHLGLVQTGSSQAHTANGSATNPTVATLVGVGRALGVTVGALFDERDLPR